MKNVILLILITLSLTGCAIFRPHKMTIEQGNILKEEEVARIHTGMSEEEVTYILGHPVLINTFSDNRMSYIYTYMCGYSPRIEKRVIIILDRGVVRKIVR